MNKKTYYQQNNIGKAKYTISFHNGDKTHPDGSKFYDIEIFKNKLDLNAFVQKLKNEGYVYK